MTPGCHTGAVDAATDVGLEPGETPTGELPAPAALWDPGLNPPSPVPSAPAGEATAQSVEETSTEPATGAEETTPATADVPAGDVVDPVDAEAAAGAVIDAAAAPALEVPIAVAAPPEVGVASTDLDEVPEIHIVAPSPLPPAPPAPPVVPVGVPPTASPPPRRPAVVTTDSDSTAEIMRRPQRPPRPLQQPVAVRRPPRARVRRVTRVVRSVDTWSVFKIAAIFNLFMLVVTLTAGVLLWHVAVSTGTIDNIERGFENVGWEVIDLKSKGGEIFQNAWIAGLFTVVGLTGMAVMFATLFNLITDLVGGVRVTVLEEEVRTSEQRPPMVAQEHPGQPAARVVRPQPPNAVESPSPRR